MAPLAITDLKKLDHQNVTPQMDYNFIILLCQAGLTNLQQNVNRFYSHDFEDVVRPRQDRVE